MTKVKSRDLHCNNYTTDSWKSIIIKFTADDSGEPFADVATNSRIECTQCKVVIEGDDTTFTNIDAKPVISNLVSVTLQS